MELLVDIGNSNIVLGLYQNEKIVKTLRLYTDRKKTKDEYAGILAGLFHDFLNGTKPDGIAIASVVPELTKILAEALEMIF